MYWAIDTGWVNFPSWTTKGEIYNPETHYLVPKEDYIDTLIKQKQEELDATKQRSASFMNSLKEKETLLQKEIDDLKSQKKALKTI